jgi:DNA-binding MarR family transcriptional regulator
MADERDRLIDDVGAELGELRRTADRLDEAVATQYGLNRTDLRCIGILYRRGRVTAGELAEESGLTPGAITTVLDRMERSGYANRVADPSDRRRVLVELTPRSRQSAAELYAAVTEAEQAEYERYTLEELRLLRDFLHRAQQIQAEHVAHLRTSAGVGDTAAGAASAAATPAGVKAGRLEFRHGAARVTLSADPDMRELYRAEFEGSPPDIRVDGGTVSVQYARRFRAFDWRRVAVHITLNGSIPWSVEVHGGLAQMEADLSILASTALDADPPWLYRANGRFLHLPRQVQERIIRFIFRQQIEFMKRGVR